ncbi:unnamed protein product [Blepharisma stoltei]|uniref:Polyadenylate-binding protein n=1 Tax=Blepharisma stoltei TaxID=1481888 RepID=A0AAU9K6P0_9CILI|nr:unnamed protein product [Blepharisma stoltei]
MDGILGQLLVSDLAYDISERELYNLFLPYGRIEKISLNRKKEKNLSSAIITYSDENCAKMARLELNGIMLKSKHILVIPYSAALQKIQKANIFVKNIPKDFTTKDLEAWFSKYGEIVSSKICYNANGQPLGYGFIQFTLKDAADKAVQAPIVVKDTIITAERFIPKQDRAISSKNNVYVRGFNEAFSEESLEAIFSEYGKVTSKIICKDPDGNSKCFGFVCFEHSKSAEQAVQALHGKTNELGFEWFVCQAVNKFERSLMIKRELAEKREDWKKRNLCLKGIPTGLTEEQLKEILREYGEIESLKIATIDNYRVDDIVTLEKKPTGTVLVCFKDKKEAEKALNRLQHLKINNLEIKVFKWKPRAELIQSIKKHKNTQKMPPEQILKQNGQRFFNPWIQPKFSYRQLARPRQIYQNQKYTQDTPQRSPECEPVNFNYEFYQISDGPTRKQILGETIYTEILPHFKEFTGKVTGMILEMPETELLGLLKEKRLLNSKANEALEVLKEHLGRHN